MGKAMKIEITTAGEYRDGRFFPTEIKATSGDGESYTITRDTDGSFCVESFLLGDKKPDFSGDLTFDEAWNGLAVAFGVIEQ